MARLAPARRVALALVGRRRRQQGRIRDLARTDEGMGALSPRDRSLAFRLCLGTTAAEAVLDELLDALMARPGDAEPKVRDALRLAAFELGYLDTPASVAVSQGVELVRRASPRAAGLANAVLRRMAREVRPRIDAARTRVAHGEADIAELSLVSGLPPWLCARFVAERGVAFACALCASQLAAAPVFVAANARRHDPGQAARMLARAGLAARPLEGLSGSFALEAGPSVPLAPLVEGVDVVTADLSSQLVCRVAAPGTPGRMLEVGQGRGTKSVLLAGAAGAVWPTRVDAVDSVAYKVALSRRRMEAAGLAGVVFCHELDARLLGDDAALPPELAGTYDAVLVDAPCSGTGTMRRHPETPAALAPDDVAALVRLQGELLEAAAARVGAGGTLTYATCSVLREEDEEVIARFLASPAGAPFALERVAGTPACAADLALARLVAARETPEGFLLVTPAGEAGDGHFCARMRRH